MWKETGRSRATTGPGLHSIEFEDILTDLVTARRYLRALARALWEGGTSTNPQVTAVAIALLKYQAYNPPGGRQ